MYAPQIYLNLIVPLRRPVPSLTPIYKTTLTQTTNETTSTWTGVDIGEPHKNRLVILATYQGVAAVVTCTVAGYQPIYVRQNTSHEFSIMAVNVPTSETTDTITVSAASSVRKAVAVYVAYPANIFALDGGTNSATGTTPVTVNNTRLVQDGFLIYVGGQNAVNSTWTVGWANGGGETPVESVDATLETGSYTAGYIIGATSSNSGDLSLTASVTGTKRGVTSSWSGPYL